MVKDMVSVVKNVIKGFCGKELDEVSDMWKAILIKSVMMAKIIVKYPHRTPLNLYQLFH